MQPPCTALLCESIGRKGNKQEIGCGLPADHDGNHLRREPGDTLSIWTWANDRLRAIKVPHCLRMVPIIGSGMKPDRWEPCILPVEHPGEHSTWDQYVFRQSIPRAFRVPIRMLPIEPIMTEEPPAPVASIVQVALQVAEQMTPNPSQGSSRPDDNLPNIATSRRPVPTSTRRDQRRALLKKQQERHR